MFSKELLLSKSCDDGLYRGVVKLQEYGSNVTIWRGDDAIYSLNDGESITCKLAIDDIFIGDSTGYNLTTQNASGISIERTGFGRLIVTSIEDGFSVEVIGKSLGDEGSND